MMLAFAFALALQSRPVSIIPAPVSLSMPTRAATFLLDGTTRIDDPKGTFAGKFLHDLIRQGSGYDLRFGASRLPAIHFVEDSAQPKEGYALNVAPDGITIRYGDSGGALYAVETLRQMLPPQIERKMVRKPIAISAAEIHDSPRFSWRGMHLDVSRHFFPVSFIKRYLDYCAMMKVNVFHWHLVDDGGWRLQIDKYPKLTSMGAWRYGVTTGWDQSKLSFSPSSPGQPRYGGFYTKREVRDVLKYAADRNITVVPEIEMPGHAMPVFAAYPELGCQNQPASTVVGQPSTNVYCAGSEQTYRFIEDVLTEVMDLFPSKWIHIGGDEVWKGYWQRCPLCQAKMKEEGLKNEEGLQSYFIQRIDKFLSAHGRRLIGWDEILEGGLASGATVMSWRGIDGGIAAARSGHDVVMSPTDHCYFDYPYSGQSTEHVYTFEPVPDALSPEEAKHVLGGQANVWTEMIPSVARCETMIWPRMAAMAETLWSPKASRNWADFQARLGPLIARLDVMGVNYYIPAPQVPLTAIVYRDFCRVAATPDPAMPGTLRFSFGGDPVTPDSKAYTGPITMVGGAQDVNFAYVSPNRRVGEAVRVMTRKAENIEIANPVAGWKLSTYEGAFSGLPDFSRLTPTTVETANAIGLAKMPRAENAALYFEGFLKIEQPGVYTFGLRSDDGSALKVAGATVVDNDGLHGAVEKTGSVMLPAGWHRIEIGFFQAGGAASLSASLNGKPLDGLVFRSGPE